MMPNGSNPNKEKACHRKDDRRERRIFLLTGFGFGTRAIGTLFVLS